MIATTTVYQVTLSDHYHHGKDKAEYDKKCAQLAAIGIGTREWEEDSDFQSIITDTARSFPADEAKIAKLTIAGIGITVGPAQQLRVDISEALQELAEKQTTLRVGGGGDTFNHKCEVHMPGQALSMYNDMMLLEDACTDALQANLNKGWRIVAAMPQPDQRRPDYILGRFNPDRDIADGAQR